MEIIKKLISKDKDLAVKVAKVLNYKVFSKNNGFSKELSSKIKSILDASPKIVVKESNKANLYYWGRPFKNYDYLIMRVANREGKWDFILDVSYVKGKPIVKSATADSGEKILEKLSDALLSVRRSLKRRKLVVKNDGKITNK